jgi:hypothetical protein
LSCYNIDECPNCGYTRIAVQVTSWADFHHGEPDCFDDEDIDYVDPIAGGEAFCRRCNHNWRIESRADGQLNATKTSQTFSGIRHGRKIVCM